MKNKFDFASAVEAAEKIKIELTEKKYRGFPDVCDFCAEEKAEGDGELRLKNDVVEWISADSISREYSSGDALCCELWDSSKVSGGDK